MESKFLSQVKLVFIINNVTLISRCGVKKMALLVLRRVGLCVGQNQMCHLCVGIFSFLCWVVFTSTVVVF